VLGKWHTRACTLMDALFAPASKVDRCTDMACCVCLMLGHVSFQEDERKRMMQRHQSHQRSINDAGLSVVCGNSYQLNNRRRLCLNNPQASSMRSLDSKNPQAAGQCHVLQCTPAERLTICCEKLSVLHLGPHCACLRGAAGCSCDPICQSCCRRAATDSRAGGQCRLRWHRWRHREDLTEAVCDCAAAR